jgi:hypothetical protein
MLTLICGYLGLGAITSLSMYFIYYEPKSQFSSAIDEVLNGKKSWHYKLRESLVIPGTILLITVVWPLALWMVIKDRLDKKNRKLKKSPEELFAVKTNFLIEKLSIGQVEAREIYLDPLHATPQIPFGYLNSSWEKFKLTITDEDELWSFLVPKGEPVGEYEMPIDFEMVGYALVRDGRIVGEFVCEANGAY